MLLSDTLLTLKLVPYFNSIMRGKKYKTRKEEQGNNHYDSY